MSAPHERQAVLQVFGAPPTGAVAVVAAQNPGQRLARAIGVLAACWAAAVVSIFIPLAHFVLVPGFLVLGIGLGLVRGRERERLLSLRGTCPRCGQAEEFGRGGHQGGRLWVTCPGCHNRVRVTIEPGGPPGPRAPGQPRPAGGAIR